jgi:flavin reductase (DIM6/NTAB) family NADH-FMN oxidoreductase RutF
MDTSLSTDFDPTLDQRALRNALGSFATGVTIVTTHSDDGPIGITANSFASVSLDPPLVLWSPARSSKRFGYFETASRFAVHVLGLDQRGICDGFTQGKSAFDGLDWTAGNQGTPLINGCLARFECETHATHEGGDHLIIVGRVTGASARVGAPLMFQGGNFVSVKD